MEENDSRPETDQTCQFQENEIVQQPTGPEILHELDEEEDVHMCRKCNMVFYDIQMYLEHKIKHDNFKVTYRRSDIDKRMIMPKLVQKVTVKKEPKPVTETSEGNKDDEKENERLKNKGKRGRKKMSEVHDQDLVIREKPVYICEKCDKKFNREATLRRHIEYDHNEDDMDDSDDMQDDDRDKDYKPRLDIKEEISEDLGSREPAEMDSLDRVIMAAQLMEQAEGNQTVQPILATGVALADGTIVLPPAKKQKLSEEERTARKFGCPVCGNRFKELNVLKTHMLTHSEKRTYTCIYEGCTYSFKTKGSLKRHMRRHTGERPFPCELCGRSFAESGALTRHLKSRTPCTRKTDNDLPRYGKKWTYTPNIPAAMSRTGTVQHGTDQDQHAITDTLEINKDTMIEHIPEISSSLGPEVGGAGETLSGITTVVQVLDESLQGDQQREFFELERPEGVEIVISGTGEVGDDLTSSSIGQFVQSETEIREGQSTSCRVCKEDFLSEEALRIHLRTHLADSSCRCWLCHFVSESKDEFENHMLMHHHVQLKGNDPFNALLPVESKLKEIEASKDKNNIHRDAQIAVKQLLELPQDSLELQDSQDDLSSRMLYKCPVCMRSFRGSYYLKLHMRNHTGLRPHKCTECDKSFITKDTLNKHISTHVEDRNFKCGECGKLFKRLSHVREHIKIHSGARPFPCSICEKTFKTNNAMKVHLRTHTDILPYECQYCHRRFREKGSVLRHTRMHTGEKPHMCKFCGRGFAEHGTLNRHLKAKVSCTKQLQDIRDNDSRQDTDYTVLAEFSSVVADTQQYILPEEEHADIGEPDLQTDQPQQAAEFVVVQTTDEGSQVQNVEIITEENGEASMLEGIQVTDDYVVISEPDGSGMKILDSKSGEIVAIVPITSVEETENPDQVESITMSEEGKIAAITMTSGTEIQAADAGIETVPTIASLIANGTVLEQVIEESEEADITGIEETMEVVGTETEIIESMDISQTVVEQTVIAEPTPLGEGSHRIVNIHNS